MFRREFDNLHGKKRTMPALGIDQFVLVFNICL